jgi:hypothetical protein
MQPVAPIGWPREMPLPLGFVLVDGDARQVHVVSIGVDDVAEDDVTEIFRARHSS